MTESDDLKRFNNAMSTILKADPKAVREQMETDAKARAEARQSKRASLASDHDQDGRV